MKVLVTGARGFIGTNLQLFLKGREDIHVVTYDSNDTDLEEKIRGVDFVVHLAGVNRPKDVSDFKSGNTDLTRQIVDLLNQNGAVVPLIFASSTQAELDNDYGRSKKAAEDYIFETYPSGIIYRLTNVFGKFCRPNYNSVVATFCHNIANGEEIEIDDPDKMLKLIYIDDVCKEFIDVMDGKKKATEKYNRVEPIYTVTIAELAKLIYGFRESMQSIDVPRTGDEFVRKLFSTYISYCNLDEMILDNEVHEDERGIFSELIHTMDSGQFSFSVSHPGVTRGNHYHHTKIERFMVVKGEARILLRKVGDATVREYVVSDKKMQSVTMPVGYTHSITNIGDTDMILAIWCNEVFDKNNPDTFYEEV